MALLEGTAWTLHIVGSGELKELVVNCGLSNVVYLGVLDWQAVQQELSHARCLVLPTKADTSTNVVKEARVVGVPVVTTKHGGQSGYIHDGVNGLIADPLNVQSLSHCLMRVMNHSCYAASLGKSNQEVDRAYFDPQNTARGFVNIYRELLA
jgi:glycosyltransferase involved in cell wall biosynthesis